MTARNPLDLARTAAVSVMSAAAGVAGTAVGLVKGAVAAGRLAVGRLEGDADAVAKDHPASEESLE